MTASAPDPLDIYLALLDEAFDHKAWHGTTLRGSLRGVTPEEAAWVPGPGRHNIWEIVLHTAYWKYAVARRLTGEKAGSFVLPGSNWFSRPDTVSARSWRGDVHLLDAEHQHLRTIVSGLEPRDLDKRPPRIEQTRGFMLRGIAAHDLYHAGQIQLLKRLARQ